MIKENPYFVDGMAPEEYDKELDYNRFDYKKHKTRRKNKFI